MVRGRKNPLHLKFPERLRRARKEAALSASALSLTAGISKGGTAKLEAGSWVPRLSTVERLAVALRVSPAWLAFGIEADWPTPSYVGCSELAVRVGEARALRGFSIRELERRASSAEGSIRAVESGTMPSLETLERIAKALDVSPAWLAFGQGPQELPARRLANPEAPVQTGVR